MYKCHLFYKILLIAIHCKTTTVLIYFFHFPFLSKMLSNSLLLLKLISFLFLSPELWSFPREISQTLVPIMSFSHLSPLHPLSPSALFASFTLSSSLLSVLSFCPVFLCLPKIHFHYVRANNSSYSQWRAS